MKIKDYEGHEIFVDSEGMFEAMKDSYVVAKDKTLEGLEKQIGKLLKAQLGQSVIVNEYGRFRQGKITSVRTQYRMGGDKLQFRVVFEDRGWSDVDVRNLFKDTQENHRKVEQIEELKKKEEEIEQQIEQLSKSFEAYTEEELIDKTGLKNGKKL